MIKDRSNAIKLDQATNEGASITLYPVCYAVLSVHNEESTEPDYRTYMIMGNDGKKYTTGSESFWSSFTEIWEEMKDEGDFEIEVYKIPSKNYAGKGFLSCSLV